MKFLKNLKWFWVHKKISVVLIVLIALGIWWGFFRGNGKTYEEAKVGIGEVKEELILSGIVVADEDAKLNFPTGGKINYVSVKEGDKVRRGQFLMSIDSTGLNSVYQQALATLRAAEANVDLVHDEVKGNDSDESFDEKNTRVAAEAAKDKAYEAMIIAQDNLSGSKIYAPFEGYITYLATPFPGINVFATQTQVQVVNPETIHFEVAADQTEVVDIQKGEKVEIVLDSLENQKLQGEVSYIAYSLSPDASSAVYEVKINLLDVENSSFTYRIGMTGDAHFVLNKKESVLYVPSTFIKSDDKGNYLLTNNGKGKVYIQIGLEGEERTEVSGEGLSEGMLIYD